MIAPVKASKLYPADQDCGPNIAALARYFAIHDDARRFLVGRLFLRCRIKLEERRRTRDGRSKETYSITSSARRRNDSWIARPMAFAVLRLIVSSNFVGCSTGRSTGFVPCRILCT